MSNIKRLYALVIVAVMVLAASVMVSLGQSLDLRNITTGTVLPSENYSDQPFCLITNATTWLCTITTGTGNEGDAGQHIIATISSDNGTTWGAPINIEPAGPPESSWAMP